MPPSRDFWVKASLVGCRWDGTQMSPAAVTIGNLSESGQEGWKTQGGGKHTVNSAKNPSTKTFLDPPTYDTFSPPLFWRLSVISLKRKRHRRDQPQFLRPPKVVLESTLCSTFPPPPPNSRDTFCPPPPLSRCPKPPSSLRRRGSWRVCVCVCVCAQGVCETKKIQGKRAYALHPSPMSYHNSVSRGEWCVYVCLYIYI